MQGISFDFGRNNIFYYLIFKGKLSSGLPPTFEKSAASYDYMDYDMENLAKIDRYSLNLDPVKLL